MTFKNIGYIIKKLTVYLMLICTVFFGMINMKELTGVAAKDTFEASIQAFPESYRVYLRALHKSHPTWSFNALETGLDWYESVSTQASGQRSAVPKDASDFTKQFVNGSTVFNDAGWVNADEKTVAFFLDPRNFLNEENIFQFELLAFSDKITVADVDKVLKNTFMCNTKISYNSVTRDSKGNITKQKTVTTKITYAECIYNAGKKYDINPCYIASKIRNEIVINNGGASGSVTGKFTGYEGYYNFFNIGAYSGISPITNGLKYASGSGSFSRPWNTPEKSIMGGAEFLASQYIAYGQNTGYLQKFNVNPATGNVHLHQYMSNISGADSQGYSTYLTYVEDGLLELNRTFSIPVFKNMPGEEKQTENYILNETIGQIATTDYELNLRKEANIYSQTLSLVPKGTTVTVLQKCRTNLNSYTSNLYYPYWCKISYYVGKVSFTGYVNAAYLSYVTTLNVNKGDTFSLYPYCKGSEKPSFYTDDSSIVKVNSNGSLYASKKGTVNVLSTTSKNGFEVIKIKVGSYDNDSLSVKNLALKQVTASSASFSWSKCSDADGYDFILYSSDEIIYTKQLSLSKTSLSVSGLPSGTKYTAKIRAYTLSSNKLLKGEFSSASGIITVPSKITDLKLSEISDSSFKLSWSASKGATGYSVYVYNTEKSKYVRVTNTSETSYVVSNLSKGYSASYIVKPYIKVNSEKVYSDASNAVTGYTFVYSFENIKSTSKESSVTFSWKKIENVTSYNVYSVVNGKRTAYKKITDTKFTADNLASSSEYTFYVEALNDTSANPVAGVQISSYTMPSKVTEIKQSYNTGYRCDITWKSLPNADGYIVYLFDEKKKIYNEIGRTTQNIFSKTGLEPLSEYKVKVLAYNYFGESCVTSQSYDEFTIYTGSKKVSGVKYSVVKENSVKLKWNKISGVEKYLIYSYSSSKSTWNKIGECKENSFTATKLNSGTKYSFRVEAVVCVNSKLINGSKSETLSVKTKASTVTGLKLKDVSYHKYTLTWKKSAGADGYNVYVYVKSKKQYELYETVTTNSIKIKDIKASTKSTYRIKAFVINNKTKYYSEKSDKLNATTLSANVNSISGTSTSQGLKIYWNCETKADGYNIYIYNTKKQKYVYKGYSTKKNFVYTGAKYGKAYKILVKAYNQIDDTKYLSSGKHKTITYR